MAKNNAIPDGVVPGYTEYNPREDRNKKRSAWLSWFGQSSIKLRLNPVYLLKFTMKTGVKS